MKPVVLLIIPNLGGGGAQRVFRQHVRHYSSRFETISCAFNLDGAVDEDRELPIISLDVPAGRNVLEKAVNFLRRIAAVRRIKARFKVTLAVSHLEGADYVNILSGRGEKKILWIHGTKQHDREIGGWLGWIRKRWLLPSLYAKADAIACVSEVLAKEMIDTYHFPEAKVTTVHNGIDLDHVATESQRMVESWLKTDLADKFVIVTHCRLAVQKNIHAILELAASLKVVGNIKWLIIGDGPQREELLARCAALDLAIHSPWTGHVPNPDMYFLGYRANPFPYFQLCDLYIMTSLWEGFPLAICEAMACNVPVMAADCPTGPAEILMPNGDTQSACGFLMPIILAHDRKTCAPWRETLEMVIQDPSLLNLHEQRANVRIKDFSVSVMQANIDKVTSAVLG